MLQHERTLGTLWWAHSMISHRLVKFIETEIRMLVPRGQGKWAKKRCCLMCVCVCCAKSLQSCPALRDPMDGSPPGLSDHGILQARLLEWGAISFSRGSSQPRDGTCNSYVSCIGRQILYHSRHLGTLNVYRVSHLEDEKALEIYFTAMWLYLVILNCTLKNG